MVDSKDPMGLINLLESGDVQTTEDVKLLIKNELQSGKDAWLLNALVGVYFVSKSTRLIEVLCFVREPQDKYLLDKIIEHLKSPQHRVDAMNLLGQLICLQPPWLHILGKHHLLTQVIKLLKSDNSIPLLMVGTLTMTALLPAIPVSMGAHLNELFDAFLRLAGLKLKKVGSYPESYMFLFQVAVYSLFHRLYGMFPCNFLTYLRPALPKHDNKIVFEQVIMPMLEHVRMHPLLITSSKNHELEKDRWRNMEMHDIMINCGRYSLDLSESSSEELNCPVLPLIDRPSKDSHPESKLPNEAQTESPYTLTMSPPIGIPHVGQPIACRPGDSQGRHGSGTLVAAAGSLVATQGSLVENAADDIYCSPSMVCGLATPPPSGRQSTSSFTNTIEHSGRSSAQATPVCITPRVGVDSPVYIRDHVDKSGSRPVSSGATMSTDSPSIAERRAAKLTIANPGHADNFGPAMPSPLRPLSTSQDFNSTVPPSPMKPDFTSEPPLGARPLKAMRKIDLYNSTDGHHSSGLSGRLSAEQERLAAMSSDLKNVAKFDGESFSPVTTANQRAAFGSHMGNPTASRPIPGMSTSVPLCDLPAIVGSLENQMETDDDEEVSLITTEEIISEGHTSEGHTSDDASSDASPRAGRKLGAPANLEDPVSVKMFMKNVNRIRFNSMHMPKPPKIVISQKANVVRSNSCPTFQPTDDEVHRNTSEKSSPEKEVSSSSSASRKSEKTVVICEHCKATIASDKDYMNTKESESTPESTPESRETPQVDNDKTTDMPADTTTPTSDIRTAAMSNDRDSSFIEKLLTDYEDSRLVYPLPAPFVQLLKIGLPYSHITGSQQLNIEKQVPDFSRVNESAYQRLDRHLSSSFDLQQDLHVTKSKSADKGSTDYNDTNAVLRTQLYLVHSQLVFERHKRDLYVKRNRRLLRSVINTQQLKEETDAMKEQLRLQEVEFNQLTNTLHHQQEIKTRELKTKDQQVDALHETIKKQKSECNELRDKMKTLESEMESYNEKNLALKNEKQQLRASMFDLQHELSSSVKEAQLSANYKSQIFSLNKELLLMGELQQKYQERLQKLTIHHNQGVENEFLLNACKQQLNDMKRKMMLSTIDHDNVKSKLGDAEETIKIKDKAIAELKSSIEDIKEINKERLQALEDKHKAQKQTEIGLHLKVMQLHAAIDEKRYINIPGRQSSLTSRRNVSELSVSESSEVTEDDSLIPTSEATPTGATSTIAMDTRLKSPSKHKTATDQSAFSAYHK